MDFKYSIIIPHRDSEILLKRAISSIPDRSDIQIIVVDNSTYKVGVDQLKRKVKCNFVLLYSDPMKGAGHARNIGLKEATGKWLLFLDADDFFNPGAFEKFDSYKNSDSDIVYFSLNSVYSDTLKPADRHFYTNNLVNEFLLGKTNADDSLRYKYLSPYCKLIKRRLVMNHNIQFDEVPAANDLMFSVKTGYHATKISANDFQAYCATVNKGSITNTISIQNARSRFYTYIRQYKFVASIGKPDMRFLLMAEVLLSLRFGFKEFWWYISIVKKEHINIFLGYKRWPGVLYRFFFRRKRRNDYAVIIYPELSKNNNKKTELNSGKSLKELI